MGKTYDLALRALSSKTPSMTLLSGPPGTGKSHCCLEAALKHPDIRTIHIVRKPAGIGEGYGFLPGSLHEKMEEWKRNVYDLCINLGFNPNELEASGRLVFESFEHGGGITLDNSFIIIEEAQNFSMDELYIWCTRVGKYSHIALNGDGRQVAEKVHNSGWSRLAQKVYDSRLCSMQIISFKDAENMRSPLCRDVIELFTEEPA